MVYALGETLIGHVSRDATAIEGREAAVAKPKKTETPKRRRPRKGEERPKTPSRLKRQADSMSLKAMLAPESLRPGHEEERPWDPGDLARL